MTITFACTITTCPCFVVRFNLFINGMHTGKEEHILMRLNTSANEGYAQMLDVRICPNKFPCVFQGKADGLKKVIMWHTSGHHLVYKVL